MKLLLVLRAQGGSLSVLLVEVQVGHTEAKLLLQAESVYASSRKAAPVSGLNGAHTSQAHQSHGGQEWSGDVTFP